MRNALRALIALAVAGALVALGAALAEVPHRRALMRSNALVDKAQELGRMGKAKAARAAVEQALAVAPGNPRARRELAMHLVAERDLAGAVAELRAVAEAKPDDPGAALELGDALALMGDSEGAVHWLRKCIDLDPGDGIPYAILAHQLLGLGQVAEARQAAEGAASLVPQSPRILALLGFVLWTGNDTKRAEAAFRRALELDPANAEARTGLRQLRAGRSGQLRVP